MPSTGVKNMTGIKKSTGGCEVKVIGINGSARKDGNTAILINAVFEELNKEGIETEMIQLSGKIMDPCKACWACGGKGNCVHKGDSFVELFEKIKLANGIILGSPVYTANVSANMQAFLERAAVVTDMNRSENLLQHKVGAAVTAARRGGALNALDSMNHFFMLQNMFVVGSSYWPMAYGQMPGDVLNDEEGMNTMKVLGQNIAYLLKSLEERRK